MKRKSIPVRVLALSSVAATLLGSSPALATLAAEESAVVQEEAAQEASEDVVAQESAASEDAVAAESAGEYVYGTVDLPYADFYYGELNGISTGTDALSLDAADAAAALRQAGQYDAVSSATNSAAKSRGWTHAYWKENGTGTDIEGVKTLIRVEKDLYDAAKAAIAEGKTAKNPVLNLVGAMTVSDAALSEYKELYGDGTLSAMVTEKVEDKGASASVMTSSRYGSYQISVTDNDADGNSLLPDKTKLQGVLVQTSDGKVYGMEHEENLWLRTGEIAFAAEPGLEVHGSKLDYARYADMQGKTVTKITYMVADGPDRVISTDLKLKKLLTAEQTISIADAAFADGVKVSAVKSGIPADAAYSLSSLSYGGKALVAGTDYAVDGDTITIKDTDAAGPGTYTAVFSDAAYEDVSTSFVLSSGAAEGSVTLKDGKLVVPEGVKLADYLASITSVKIDGSAARGSYLGPVVFNADGSVNFDASVTAHGRKVALFDASKQSFALEITSAGFPSVSGTVSRAQKSYVYGTVDLPYADFYYGEVNGVSEGTDALSLDAADAAAALRQAGQYDAVSSATNSATKSRSWTQAYWKENGTGTDIEGVKTPIRVEKDLYDAAKAAIAEGKTAKNPVLDLVKAMTVSDAALSEYKELYGDGTLSAMVTEKVEDKGASAEVTTSSRYGSYQISVTDNDADGNSLLPDKTKLQGILVQTSDGKVYGMEHEENTWLRTGEIAFAAEPGLESHGSKLDYARYADMQGKTVTKITYMVADGPDRVISTDLLLKKLTAGSFSAADAKYADGVKVTLTGKDLPEGSSYKVAGLSYAGKALKAGTDYTVDGLTVTVKKTDSTGVGSYTVTLSDEAYKDLSCSFVLSSGITQKGTISKNTLKLPAGVDLAQYLANVTSVKLNGKAVSGRSLGTTIFDESGKVKFDAAITRHGTSTPIFDASRVYDTIEISSAGFADTTGALVRTHFTDVPAGKYYAESVAWAAQNGITAGTTATTFSPEKGCTREQFVTFLYRHAGEPEVGEVKLPFTDVKKGAYYYKAVAWAYTNNITAGVTKTRFGVRQNCTREQAIALMYRNAKSQKTSGTKNGFTDVNSKKYYYNAVQWAYENGVTSGETATKFGTGHTCTRGQLVSFLYRADDLLKK